MTTPDRPLTKKGARTRAHILETATTLFREHGYEETTMRRVAEVAGVSVGNAYYYYPSKETLVQSFYGSVHEAHLAATREVLEATKDLRKRVQGVLEKKIEVFEPYHELARVLVRTAADPRSDLNPFSEASRPVREANTAIFAEAVSGSKARIPKALKAELPDLLWVHSAGVSMYWTYDESPGFERTYALIDRSSELIVRTIKLASLPLLGPVRRLAIRMVREALHKEPVPRR